MTSYLAYFGIAPLLSMIESIAREVSPRQCWFLHGSGSADGATRAYLRNLLKARLND